MTERGHWPERMVDCSMQEAIDELGGRHEVVVGRTAMAGEKVMVGVGSRLRVVEQLLLQQQEPWCTQSRSL